MNSTTTRIRWNDLKNIYGYCFDDDKMRWDVTKQQFQINYINNKIRKGAMETLYNGRDSGGESSSGR